MSKALGKDINEFYNNHFPEGHFIEGESIDYEDVQDSKGNLILEPTQKYDLKEFGYIVPDHEEGKEVSFESAFKKWFKMQSTASLLIEIPKDKVADFTLFLKTNYSCARIIK